MEGLTWNGNTLFAHTRYLGNGMYRSEDNGKTWVEVGGFLDTLEVHFLTAWAGVLYAFATIDPILNTGGLFLSTDNGRSWKPATESIRRGTAYIHSVAFSGSWLHALTDSGYVRIDATTGKVNGSGIYPVGAQKIFASGERLFVASGVDTLIWYSENQGITWKKGAVAKPWTGYITSFASQSQAVYAGIFGSGVYRSIDGGASWEPFNAGELDPLVNCLTVSGNRLFAGTESSIYSLDAGGQTQVFGRQFRGRQGIQRPESSHRQGVGSPYLEVLLGGDRSRIIRVDGRQVTDVMNGSKDGH